MTIADFTKLNSKIINQILIAILKKDSAFLISHKNKKLNKKQVNTINFIYNKYQNNWPLPYLLKFIYFYQLKIEINQKVLIPRPETEVMLDLILKKIKQEKNNQAINILDLGTGSGAIIVNLAYILKKEKNLKFFASDISSDCLKLAQKNANKYKLNKKIKFIQANLLNKIKLNNNQLIIAANLPYLNKGEILQESLKKEPKLALYGGKDGLDIYKNLLTEVYNLKKISKISIFLEINPHQGKQLKKIIKDKFSNIHIKSHYDLRNKLRFIQLDINN
jgi:release factor glutamine methyltransferase